MRRTIARRAMATVVALGAVVLVVISNPRNGESRCVSHRTAVKTLSDGDYVNFQPVPTRIEHLRALHRPARLGAASRSLPVEATTFRVRARLVAVRRRSDGEVDLIASSPTARSSTIPVGFEGGRRCGHRAVFRAEDSMNQAQHALIAACGRPSRPRTPLTGTATITGVGFFGHTRAPGAAPNGIELQPVLEFKSSDCRRR